MKLASNQLDAFVRNPPSSVRVILVYGPDAGLVSERTKQIALKTIPDLNDPFSLSVMTGAQVASDPARFYDETAALSLTGGKRLIRIQQPTETAAKALESFLADPPATDSLILIEGGELDKKSKLRKLCETDSPLVAAIPCYAEDAAARQRTVTAQLEANKLTASREIIRLLADILPPDRLALRSELEKLALYALGQKEITLADVHAILADAGGAENDDLIMAVAGGDKATTTKLLDHLFAEQASPVALLRALQRHLLRLQLALAHMAAGSNAAEAMKKLSPPVFWKQQAPMTRQLQRWSLERVESRLAQLAEAEAMVKRTGTPDTALCAHLFLSIATKA